MTSRRGLRRQPAALLARVERGGGGFRGALPELAADHWQTAPLPELPAEEPPLEDVPAMLAGIVAQAADLVPLCQDSQRFGELPSEDE